MAICDSMRALLQAHEIRVCTYVSGKRFLEDAPDIACAIVDYEMPCLDGLRVIAELRKRAAEADARCLRLRG